MKRFSLLCMAVLVMMLAGVGGATPVQACSGSAPGLLQDKVWRADIVVHGQFVDVDDLRQNGILRVSTYLKGSGAEHILVSFNSPSSIHSERQGYTLDSNCNYATLPLPTSEDVILILKRAWDGSFYRVIIGLGDPHYYRFPNADSTVQVPVRSGEPEATDVYYVEQTLEQFKARVGWYAGQQSNAPLSHSLYPLRAPLTITTVSGFHYILPIDMITPIALSEEEAMQSRHEQAGCWSAPCRAWMPDGFDYADLRGDGVVRSSRGTLEGFAALFSSTSDAVAVWNSTLDAVQLNVYTISSQRLRPHQRAYFYLINSFYLQSTVITPNSAAWSPDGRTLAFSDSRGVWLWDVFTPASEPRWLSAIGSQEDVRIQYSPTGRHLLLENATVRQSLDLESWAVYPLGIFSPDDRLLIPYDDASQVLRLSPYQVPTAVQGESFTLKAAWRDENSYIQQVCPEQHASPECRIVQTSVLWDSTYPFRGYDLGYTFDYQPDAGLLAIGVSGSTLTIQSDFPYYRYTLDYSYYLDSDIAAIEWLPSLFYTE